jgi:hypothetical protein
MGIFCDFQLCARERAVKVFTITKGESINNFFSMKLYEKQQKAVQFLVIRARAVDALGRKKNSTEK